MIEKFKEWVDNRHDYAQAWKARTGGKILGYMCCYAPEEIAYAAGILPVRIDSSHKPQSLSAAHMPGTFCPWSRDCLGEGLQGTYNYVDGIFLGRSCRQMQVAFDIWTLNVPTSYSRFIDVPHVVQSRRARPLLRQELDGFKRSLEQWLGKTISDEKIRQAIEVYNRNRRLLMQLYEMRKADPPPLTGEEAFYVVMATMFADKAEVNSELEKLIAQLPQRKDGPKVKTRVIIIGGENSNPELYTVVEGASNVVTDDQCYGRRYFWGEVQTDKYADLLEAIAARYLEKPRCPLKDTGERLRPDYIMKLIQDYDAKAVIQVHEKFCDPHEFEVPQLRKFFQERNIPFLTLELDTTLAAGPVRLRTEALVEMVDLGV